jgi:hypothetical protein
MALFDKIFGTAHKSGGSHPLNEQVADGLAAIYEEGEEGYRYVDEDAATVGLKHLELLGSRIPINQQLEFGQRISRHVEAHRVSKGQQVYTARPKF